eukprot:gene4883-5128_t
MSILEAAQRFSSKVVIIQQEWQRMKRVRAAEEALLFSPRARPCPESPRQIDILAIGPMSGGEVVDEGAVVDLEVEARLKDLTALLPADIRKKVVCAVLDSRKCQLMAAREAHATAMKRYKARLPLEHIKQQLIKDAAKAVWGLRYTMEDKWAAVPNLIQKNSSSISSLLYKTAAGCGCIMKPTKPKHCRSGSKDKDRDKEKEASDSDRVCLVQQTTASHEQLAASNGSWLLPALSRSFVSLDQEFGVMSEGSYVGSTAVVVLLGSTRLWVAHAVTTKPQGMMRWRECRLLGVMCGGTGSWGSWRSAEPLGITAYGLM